MHLSGIFIFVELRTFRYVVANSVSDSRVGLLTQFAATSSLFCSATHKVRSNGFAFWLRCSHSSQQQSDCSRELCERQKCRAAHEVRSNRFTVLKWCLHSSQQRSDCSRELRERQCKAAHEVRSNKFVATTISQQ